MSTNHPLTGAYLPSQSADPPAGGTQISQAVSQLSPLTVTRFTSTALRDQAYSSWVAQGGVMKKNMLSATETPDARWRYNGSTWVQQADVDADTGSVSLTLASGWGGVARYRVRNGMCTLRFDVTRSSWPASAAILNSALPSAARPTGTEQTMIATWQGVFYEVIVPTSGVVIPWKSGSGGLVGTVTYPVA